MQRMQLIPAAAMQTRRRSQLRESPPSTGGAAGALHSPVSVCPSLLAPHAWLQARPGAVSGRAGEDAGPEGDALCIILTPDPLPGRAAAGPHLLRSSHQLLAALRAEQGREKGGFSQPHADITACRGSLGGSCPSPELLGSTRGTGRGMGRGGGDPCEFLGAPGFPRAV